MADMKSIVQAAVIAASLSTTAQAETVEKIGEWDLITQVSELDGRTDAIIELKSRPGPSDPLGRVGHAKLVVGCIRGDVVAYVEWPSVLSPRYSSRSTSTSVDVAYRFDDNPVKYDRVHLARSDFRSFGFWRGATAESFAASNKYVVQVNGGSEAVFDLPEGLNAMRRLRQACGI